MAATMRAAMHCASCFVTANDREQPRAIGVEYVGPSGRPTAPGSFGLDHARSRRPTRLRKRSSPPYADRPTPSYARNPLRRLREVAAELAVDFAPDVARAVNERLPKSRRPEPAASAWQSLPNTSFETAHRRVADHAKSRAVAMSRELYVGWSNGMPVSRFFHTTALPSAFTSSATRSSSAR